ncbi:MAG: hypothetical protein ACK47B_23400 [Armatimonadota bacterium]
MEPWFLLYLVLFALGAVGVALLRSGVCLLLAREDGPLLERLQWLFPLRGRWLRWGLGALFLLLGVPLIPVVLFSVGFFGAVAVGLSPFVFAVMVVRSSAAELLTLRRSRAEPHVREPGRLGAILLPATRILGAAVVAAAYGWVIWSGATGQPL